MKIFSTHTNIYRRSISLMRALLRGKLTRMTIGLLFIAVLLLQLGSAMDAHADYGIARTNDLLARVVNGPVNLTAALYDSVQSILRTVSGGRLGGTAQAIDGRAIREKNQGTPVTAVEAASTPSGVNINSPAGFSQSVQFSTGFTSQAGITINGLINASELNLGSGKITAGNVLYGITAGDGIELTGNAQNPVISDKFWKQDGANISTKQEGLGLNIAGNLTVGSAAGSIFHLKGTSTIVFDSQAVTTIAPGLANVWSIATASSTSPAISIDSAKDFIGIGTDAPNAKLSVKNSQLGSVAFQIIAAEGQTADLFQIRDASQNSIFAIDPSGHIGIGTSSSKDIALGVQGTSTFSGAVNFQSDVHFGTAKIGIGTDNPKETLSINGTFSVTKDATFTNAPIFASVANCGGGSVLETDGDGRVTCGQDDAGSGGSPPAKDKGEVTGGTVGSFAYYTGGNVVGSANNVFYTDATGSLGIGTSTPGSLLSIQGVANFSTTSTSTIYSAITVPVINATSTTATSTFANGIQLSGGCFKAANGNCAITGAVGGTFNAGTANRLTYYSAVNTLDSANFLTVDAVNSFLGIGTTTPGTTLSVQGSTTISGLLTAYGTTTIPNLTSTSTTATSSFAGPLYIASSTPTGSALFAVGTSSPLLWVDKNTGFVGIGTTSPGSILSISGVGNFTSATSTFYSGLLAHNTIQSSALIATSTLFVGGTTGSSLVVLGSGNVGIGTTSPGSILSIQGVGNFTSGVLATSTLYTGLTVPGILATSSGI
ncbi:MAG: hypothetical protein U1A23_01825, partial [Candidatus Sungbacteria bacterium]|nr:hypothetical protein [Candidatus Sungbacteria bacterium]